MKERGKVQTTTNEHFGRIRQEDACEWIARTNSVNALPFNIVTTSLGIKC